MIISSFGIVMMAEVIRHFQPKLIDMHNYTPANSISQKLYNWNTLCHKALRKLGITLSESELNGLASGQTGAIELLLFQYKDKLQTRRSQTSIHQKSSRQSLNAMNAMNDHFEQMQMMNGYNPHLQQMGMVPPPQFLPQIPLAHQFASSPPPIFPQQQQQHQMAIKAPQSRRQSPFKEISGHEQSAFQQAQTLNGRMILTTPPQQHNQKLRNATRRSSQFDSEDELRRIYDAKLDEKSRTIEELSEKVEIMKLKIEKLEQLLTLKDRRIEELTRQRSA
eukprot:Partr_v1_DN24884_c0_g1_i1_m29688 putative sperm flagellar 1